MDSVRWSRLAPGAGAATGVGVLLGSFDPPHLAHAWIARRLLDRFEQVALLVPTWHFHKKVSYPCTATLEQRLVMLAELGNTAPARISIGLAGEVLFVRLAQRLRETFPSAVIGFGMGDDGFRRMLDSPAYFERKGTNFTREDARTLEVLRRTTMVFARSALPGVPALPVPEALRRLSSTQVRATVRRMRERGIPEAQWPSALEDCVDAAIASHIARFGLY